MICVVQTDAVWVGAEILNGGSLMQGCYDHTKSSEPRALIGPHTIPISVSECESERPG